MPWLIVSCPVRWGSHTSFCKSDCLSSSFFSGFSFVASPLLLNTGLAGLGPKLPLALQALPDLRGVPSGFAPPVFLTPTPHPHPTPQQGSVHGIGWSLPTVGELIGLTGNFFSESAASIFSCQPLLPCQRDQTSFNLGLILIPPRLMISRRKWTPHTPHFRTRFLMLAYVRTHNHRDLHKPCSFWELEQEVQVKSGAGVARGLVDP